MFNDGKIEKQKVAFEDIIIIRESYGRKDGWRVKQESVEGVEEEDRRKEGEKEASEERPTKMS